MHGGMRGERGVMHACALCWQAALGADTVKNGLGQTMKLKWLRIDKATKRIFRQEASENVGAVFFMTIR